MSKTLSLNTEIATKRVSSVQIVLALLTIVVIASVALGQQKTSSSNSAAQPARASQQSGNDANTVFRSARDLITDGEWAKAQDKFSEYVTSYPNEKNIDAALYWLAYTQNKLTRYDQCRSTIDKLLQKYPNTSWKEDARVLLAQVPGAYSPAYQDLISTMKPGATVAVPAAQGSVVYETFTPMAPFAVTAVPGQAVAPALWKVDEIASLGGSDNDDDPCEFKIVVLQALFQTDLQRGIMAATDWLKPGSTQTVRCKSAAKQHVAIVGRALPSTTGRRASRPRFCRAADRSAAALPGGELRHGTPPRRRVEHGLAPEPG